MWWTCLLWWWGIGGFKPNQTPWLVASFYHYIPVTTVLWLLCLPEKCIKLSSKTLSLLIYLFLSMTVFFYAGNFLFNVCTCSAPLLFLPAAHCRIEPRDQAMWQKGTSVLLLSSLLTDVMLLFYCLSKGVLACNGAWLSWQKDEQISRQHHRSLRCY